MTQADDLTTLLTLRRLRLRRAETALVRQQTRCADARTQVAAAAARLAAHRDEQDQRERVLLDGLIGRVATVRDVERVRDAFATFEEQSQRLAGQQRDAQTALRDAIERRQELARDYGQRRREQDRMAGLAAQAARRAQHRAELIAEVEQEDRLVAVSASGHLAGRGPR